MELLFNDLSLSGQYHDSATFNQALVRIIKMREVAVEHGYDIHCSMNILMAHPVNDKPIMKTINEAQGHQRNDLRSVMIWFSNGPHWDSPGSRQCGQHDRIEYNGEDMTESVLAEAAVRKYQKQDCGLVSMEHPDWNNPLIEVIWRNQGGRGNDESIKIDNWWERAALEPVLREIEPPVRSWEDMKKRAESRFGSLKFSSDCIDQLPQGGFSPGLADEVLRRLGVLNDLLNERDEQGKLTAKGREIYQKHFQGKHAWFSDSSKREKQKYRDKLEFKDEDGNSVFCPWHGKTSLPDDPLRFHFEWPVEGQSKVLVPYIGPKLTKQ